MCFASVSAQAVIQTHPPFNKKLWKQQKTKVKVNYNVCIRHTEPDGKKWPANNWAAVETCETNLRLTETNFISKLVFLAKKIEACKKCFVMFIKISSITNTDELRILWYSCEFQWYESCCKILIMRNNYRRPFLRQLIII